MNFKEFFDLFLEAPIGTFELKGKWGEGGPRHGYDPASIKLLTNPKFVEKVKAKWKTEYDFDLYFVKKPGLRNYSEIGRVNWEFVRDKLKLDITLNDSAITVIYINNAGDEKIPMTNWIIAHRLGHALARDSTRARPSIYSRESDTSANRYYYDELQREIYRVIDEIATEIYGENPKSVPIYGMGNKYDIQNNQRKENIRRKIAEALGTFKSARENNLRQLFEITNELIAQYILQGKITFNKTMPRIIPLKKFYKNTIDSARKNRDLSPEDEKNIIESGEDIINSAIHQLLGACVGSIFVM